MPGDQRTRGQSGIDFLVGIGVFLLTVGAVVGVLPGMFAPFTGQQAAPFVADRTVETLAGDAIAGDAPGTLDVACTAAFFGVSVGDADCPFDPTTDLHDRLSVPAGYDLNVTVERDVTGGADREILCASADAVGACDAVTDHRLAAGEAVPRGSATVVSATRLAAVGDREVTVVVRVW